MSYLGNTPTTQSFISGTDYFNGTGAQTAFTLSRAVASINDIQVTVNNVVQQPNSGYTISGTTLTFDQAPSAGTNNVYVRYLSTTTQAITPSQNTVNYGTFDQNMQSAISTGNKNRIINGAMVIDQRNAGAAVTATGGNGVYAVDRFNTSISTGSCTAQQSTTAPVGFNYSLSLTVGTSGTPSASAQNTIQQVIEGYNMSDFGWGTANAKQVTLSFWVRSSLTGTFAVAFQNVNYDRYYVSTYTISAANTWEQKSITLTGDTTGTWNSTNGSGIRLKFDMGYGSNFNTTANAWGAGEFYTVSGTTKLVANSAATFYITGVQLEKGTQATSFEYRQYGTELALCQRYYEKSYATTVVPATATDDGRLISISGVLTGNASAVYAASVVFAVEKRAAPTVTPYDGSGNSGKITTFNAVATPSQNVTPTYGFGETSTRGTRMATLGNIAGIGCQWVAAIEL